MVFRSVVLFDFSFVRSLLMLSSYFSYGKATLYNRFERCVESVHCSSMLVECFFINYCAPFPLPFINSFECVKKGKGTQGLPCSFPFFLTCLCFPPLLFRSHFWFPMMIFIPVPSCVFESK